MITELQGIIECLSEYKTKLEKANTQYSQFCQYLSDKGLQKDFEQWQVDLISLRGQDFLDKIEAQKEIAKQNFNSQKSPLSEPTKQNNGRKLQNNEA